MSRTVDEAPLLRLLLMIYILHDLVYQNPKNIIVQYVCGDARIVPSTVGQLRVRARILFCVRCAQILMIAVR